MIVWGGHSTGGELNTGGRYNPAANSWLATSTGEGVPLARSVHAAVWTGAEMIVWGGWGENPNSSHDRVQNTGGRYDPATDGWLATSTGEGVPPARAGHAAVWTGAEMIVWGGWDGYSGISTGVYTGARYDPTLDAWQSIATPDPLFNSIGIRSVWTGTEVIVTKQETHRYNPTTDEWTATAPGPYQPYYGGHTALWTGSEMIVWGGAGAGGTYFNAGGRYDPASDAWESTSMGSGVPSPRASHSALWTGTEMIVWGGIGDAGLVASGSRYDRATDAWEPTSMGPGVPFARGGHTAVWTGTEMIVWGGQPGWVSSGSRYDPATDSWLATSTGSGISNRDGHTAVWTGKEMIIWGGRSNKVPLVLENDGFRYDPSTDTWVPTSLTPAVPSPRNGHSAIWTGTGMIVWGGNPASANGARYCGCPLPMTSYADDDGDGHGDSAQSITTCDGSIPPGHTTDAGDCNDANPDVWSIPGEARELTWSSTSVLSWSAPESPGRIPQALVYDTLRSTSPADFDPAICVETNGTDATSTVEAVPPTGSVYFYLVRPENACGGGSLGNGTAGPRPPGVTCD
jgi:N-acetylneuraminic acid mutarotase